VRRRSINSLNAFKLKPGPTTTKPISQFMDLDPAEELSNIRNITYWNHSDYTRIRFKSDTTLWKLKMG